jgi:tetratricopeptide (TPR) repeat protein
MTAAKAKTMFDEAVQSGMRRDYARSASLLTEIIAEGDGHPEAYLFLGRARHALGQHPQAIQAFQAFADSGGDMAAALFFSGRSFLAMGLATRAVSSFRRCLELSPGSAQCMGLLGIALLKEGRPARAAEVLERAVEAAPSDARIYRAYLNALFIHATRKLAADEIDAAEKMLSFIIENGHEGLPPRLFRARALFRLGRWEEALGAYDDVIARGGKDPAILLRKALILGALGRAEEARSLWDGLRGSIRGLPPSIPGVKAYPALAAIAELERGDWKEASASAISGLKLDPRDPLLHAVAAEAFMETGSFVKAANHFKRSLEADPSNRAAREALVACLWNSGDLAGLKKELRALKKAESDSEEGSAAVLERYGLLLDAREKEADPSLLLRLLKAIEKTGPDKELMALLASSALSLGRHSLALPWFKRLSEEEPSSIRNRRGLLACLAETGPADELDEAYRSFIADFPDDAQLRREYADKLRAVERWEEAAAHYEALLPFEREKRALLEIVAFCLRNAGRFREAAVIYRDLALKDQQKKAYAKGLIFCLYKMKRSGIALTLADSALRQFKGEADMVFLRAWLLAKTGKAEKALDALRSAVDAMPKNPEPWRMMADIHASLGSRESEARCRHQAEALLRASSRGSGKRK